MKAAKMIDQVRCPECNEGMKIGRGHILDPGWVGVFCTSCGYHNPPLDSRSIRYGVVIKVLKETRNRLIDAKEALGHSTYDSLFNWLLEQVGQ